MAGRVAGMVSTVRGLSYGYNIKGQVTQVSNKSVKEGEPLSCGVGNLSEVADVLIELLAVPYM